MVVIAVEQEEQLRTHRGWGHNFSKFWQAILMSCMVTASMAAVSEHEIPIDATPMHDSAGSALDVGASQPTQRSFAGAPAARTAPWAWCWTGHGPPFLLLTVGGQAALERAYRGWAGRLPF